MSELIKEPSKYDLDMAVKFEHETGWGATILRSAGWRTLTVRRFSMDGRSYREILHLHQVSPQVDALMCGKPHQFWTCPTLVLVRKLRNLECSFLGSTPMIG